MLDELHIIFISIILLLILYLVYLANLEKLKIDNVKNNADNNESDTEYNVPFINKPIVVYKMEYRNRNLTL
jgi:hypothetical protein